MKNLVLFFALAITVASNTFAQKAKTYIAPEKYTAGDYDKDENYEEFNAKWLNVHQKTLEKGKTDVMKFAVTGIAILVMSEPKGAGELTDADSVELVGGVFGRFSRKEMVNDTLFYYVLFSHGNGKDFEVPFVVTNGINGPCFIPDPKAIKKGYIKNEDGRFLRFWNWGEHKLMFCESCIRGKKVFGLPKNF